MKRKIMRCNLYSEFGGEVFNHNIPAKSDDLHVTLRLTNNCSYKCNYCYFYKEGEEFINLENFVSICDTLLKTGRDDYEFYIHGGEPSFHPQFHRIISHIDSAFAGKRLLILIQTNLYQKVNAYIALPVSVKYLVSYHPAKTKFKVFKRKLHKLYQYKRLACVDFMLEHENRKVIKGDFLRLKQTEWGHLVRPRLVSDIKFPDYDEIIEKFTPVDRQYLLTFEGGETALVPESKAKQQSFRFMKCNAGKKRVVVDPDGSYWGCQTQMVLGKAAGNLLEDPAKFLKYVRSPMVCLWQKCLCEIDLEKWVEKNEKK